MFSESWPCGEGMVWFLPSGGLETWELAIAIVQLESKEGSNKVFEIKVGGVNDFIYNKWGRKESKRILRLLPDGDSSDIVIRRAGFLGLGKFSLGHTQVVILMRNASRDLDLRIFVLINSIHESN